MAGGRNRQRLRLLARAFSTPADPSDPDQVDPELLEAWAPVFDRVCRAWYRLDVQHMDRVPDGPALLVGNHNSGTVYLEALGVGARWIVDRGAATPWGALGHDVVVDAPLLGRFLVRSGAMRASHASAAAMFERGRKVVVYPGGNREAFRPWSRRHRVELAGRTGFIRLALRHGVPIVPMVSIGGHDGLFVLHDGAGFAKRSRIARGIRSDTWPVMLALPWGVAVGPLPHLPLPSKCVTRFLEPISMDPWMAAGPDDPAALAEIYALVEARMQDAMDDLASRRRIPVVG